MPSKPFCRSASEGMQSVILPSWNSGFEQTNSTRKLTFLGAVSWWARVDYASRASKKAPQGLFSPPDCSAGRCCSNPPLRVKLKMPDKTKNQRNFYAGFFGGRGWIRTSSTITIRWMRFEIVMDSCAFFECHRKSIIGYHNHLGTKTGYKVGYFARGEYSAKASETAIAAVSALPSTA